MMKITSRDNSLLRRARSVRDGKVPESIFVEGLRLCEEALASGLSIEAVIYSDEIARKDRAASLLRKLAGAASKSAEVSERLLASISFTKTPQGIIVEAERPATDELTFAERQANSPLLTLLHEVNNPMNAGAILRAAEAAGVSGVITTLNTADPFSAKALRGAMGSAFRLSIWMGPSYTDAIAWCHANNIRTISAVVDAKKLYTEINWGRPSALIVGRESSGLTPEEISMADDVVRVPMQGNVESLNVAVAAGIILYEAARQRGQK